MKATFDGGPNDGAVMEVPHPGWVSIAVFAPRNVLAGDDVAPKPGPFMGAYVWRGAMREDMRVYEWGALE